MVQSTQLPPHCSINAWGRGHAAIYPHYQKAISHKQRYVHSSLKAASPTRATSIIVLSVNAAALQTQVSRPHTQCCRTQNKTCGHATSASCHHIHARIEPSTNNQPNELNACCKHHQVYSAKSRQSGGAKCAATMPHPRANTHAQLQSPG
jgi:hypothetical protein